jgi:L-histidine N-alpha-methyltransferase
VRYKVETYLDDEMRRRDLAEDVRRGLTAPVKSLPPKYFYDETGSALFERITRLPEYYVTRAEEALLARCVPEIVDRVRPADLVELGAGGGGKITYLLDAHRGRAPVRYVPVEVDAAAVAVAAGRLLPAYPFVEIHGVVGDFERHLDRVPPAAGRRLVAFLGSTIGNLDADARVALVRRVRTLLTDDDDRFLLGVDLVKDRAVLEAAYDDAAGVTAEFNRNILRVVNRDLKADFRPERFRHHARYDEGAARIEMHLVPESPQRVTVRELGLEVEVAPDETIWTESSYKFTRESTERMLAAGGLVLEAWFTDDDSRVALALAAPARRGPAAAAARPGRVGQHAPSRRAAA